jgi:hypothetical protein
VVNSDAVKNELVAIATVAQWFFVEGVERRLADEVRKPVHQVSLDSCYGELSTIVLERYSHIESVNGNQDEIAMSESATDSDSRRINARILLWLLRPVVAILVVIAAAPIVYRSTQFAGIPPIDQLVDPEIDGRVVMPGDEKAFTFYRRASLLLPAITTSIDDGIGVTAIDRGEDWAVVPVDVRDHLKKCKPALAEWKLGTELDDGHYLDVADFDYSTRLPVVQDLRRFARVAGLQMLRCQDEGETREAWTWLRAALRSSRHAGKHGVAIERLVGASIHSRTARAVVHWASWDEVSSEQLAKALGDLREIYRLTAATSATMKAEAILASNSLRGHLER